MVGWRNLFFLSKATKLLTEGQTQTTEGYQNRKINTR